jgi:hypothetical protein
VIWVGQWRDFFGLRAQSGGHFHEQVSNLLLALPQLDTPTAALAIASLLLVIYGPRVPGLARVPGPLIALLFATVAHSVLHLDSVATIGSAFGGIPRGLPSLSFPDITFGSIVTLVPAAFTIAMLGHRVLAVAVVMACPKRVTTPTRSHRPGRGKHPDAALRRFAPRRIDRPPIATALTRPSHRAPILLVPVLLVPAARVCIPPCGLAHLFVIAC